MAMMNTGDYDEGDDGDDGGDGNDDGDADGGGGDACDPPYAVTVSKGGHPVGQIILKVRSEGSPVPFDL